MVKYRISTGKKSLPSIQAEAIKAASDNDDTADDDTASKKWESDLGKVVNPVQKLFRRHSSLTMKHCPYTHGSHVIYECPSCLAKVSDSAWHQSDVCARTGGGAFFTLRERLATLMDITEDVDEVRVYLRIHTCTHTHVQYKHVHYSFGISLSSSLHTWGTDRFFCVRVHSCGVYPHMTFLFFRLHSN